MTDESSSGTVPILIGVAIGTVVGGALLGLLVMALRPSSTPVDEARSSPATTPPASAPPAAIANHPAASTPSTETPPTAEVPTAAPSPELVANSTMPPEQVAEIRKKMKRIGIAFQNFHDSKKSFPPGARPNGNYALSWRVYLLPYLEEKPLYDRFRLDEPWNSPHNLQLVPLMPEAYRTGDNPEESHFLVFTGENTLFRPERSFSLRQCADGTSKTILAVHTGAGVTVPWTKPDDLPFDPTNPLRGIGPINGRIETIMVSVAPLSLPSDIAPATFAALVTPAGNELIDSSLFTESQAALQKSAAASVNGPKPGGLASQVYELSNRLHSVAWAMGDVYDTQKRFPPSAYYTIVDGKPSPEMSWRVMILPWLEERQLFGRYNRKEAWDSATNRELLKFRPANFGHPAEQDIEKTRVQVFVGPGTPFEKKTPEANKRPMGPDLHEIKDGTSKTILFAVLGADRAVPWTEPRDMAFDPDKPLAALGTIDPTGIHVAMFDGSVRVLEPDVDPQVFKSMVLENDGK